MPRQCSSADQQDRRNGAVGIARGAGDTGWFKEVRVKELDSHAVEA